jgi:hypothetical protein
MDVDRPVSPECGERRMRERMQDMMCECSLPRRRQRRVLLGVAVEWISPRFAPSRSECASQRCLFQVLRASSCEPFSVAGLDEDSRET